MLSVGVLTYIFIYSSFRNTHLRILLLEACTFPLYVLRYTSYFQFGCCSLHLVTVLNMCSVELPGAVLTMNNVILTKWHIALSINIRVRKCNTTLTQTLSHFINNFYWELISWELISWELISRELILRELISWV